MVGEKRDSYFTVSVVLLGFVVCLLLIAGLLNNNAKTAMVVDLSSVPDLLTDVQDFSSANVVEDGSVAVSARARRMYIDTSVFAQSHFFITLFPDEKVEAVRDRPNQYQGGGETWIGHASGDEGSVIAITVKGKAVQGVVVKGIKTYEISSIGDGSDSLVLVREIDLSLLPPHRDPIAPDISKNQVEGDAASNTTLTPPLAGEGDPVIVDVMIVYTPGTVVAEGGTANIEAKIINGVALANQGYVNSQVNMQLRLIHMEEVQYVETGDMGIALNRLTVTNDGYIDNVHTLRNQYLADQVVLIDTDANYCGIAYVMENADSSFAPYAFSVVHYSCLSGFTMTHEMGHNQGQQHNHEDAHTSAVSNYSYGYRVCPTVVNGNGFRDIMSYQCAPYMTNRINQFSNPNLFYNGMQTGVVDWADISRSLNEVAPVVAAWRSQGSSSPPQAPSALFALAVSATKVNLTWSDNSADETNFKIESSLNGTNWLLLATLAADTTKYSDLTVSPFTTYYYRISAVNLIGSSGYSNVATISTPALPLAITSTLVSAIKPTTATINWTTNLPSTGSVSYGKSASLLNSVIVDTVPATSHGAYLTGLAKRTTYYYRVSATNTNGETVVSPVKSFKTSNR